jgi:hypothetical protein
MNGMSKTRANFVMPDPPHRAVRLLCGQVRMARPIQEGDLRQGIANARRDRFRPLAAAAAEATKGCACPIRKG